MHIYIFHLFLSLYYSHLLWKVNGNYKDFFPLQKIAFFTFIFHFSVRLNLSLCSINLMKKAFIFNIGSQMVFFSDGKKMLDLSSF